MIVALLLLTDVDVAALGPKQLEMSAAHFRRGNEDEGVKALDELVRVRPDLPIPADYPPLFHTLHKRALQKAKEKAHGSVGMPDGSSINGRSFPPGTTRVSDVPSGVHYVTYRGQHKRIVVGDKHIDVVFGKPDPEAILLGASASFFATDTAIGSTTPSPPSSVPVVVHQPTYRAIVASPDTPPPRPTTQRVEPTPVYKQWWLWTIVGAGVVGASVGIALWATAKVGQVHVTAEWGP